jgi:hypothetical protein
MVYKITCIIFEMQINRHRVPGRIRAEAELSGGMRAVELKKEIAKIAESAKK